MAIRRKIINPHNDVKAGGVEVRICGEFVMLKLLYRRLGMEKHG